MQHRIRAAGLLVKDNALLLIEHQDNGQTFWVPPGGGFEAVDGNTQQTVIREVWEESGLTVTEVGPLMYVREFHEASRNVYHCELFYRVEAFDGELSLKNLAGLGGDELMISACRFVTRDEMANLKVYPAELKDRFWQTLEQGGETCAHHLGYTNDKRDLF